MCLACPATVDLRRNLRRTTCFVKLLSRSLGISEAAAQIIGLNLSLFLMSLIRVTMMLSQGQRPIQDLLDSLSAEELDSCGQGPLRTNCGLGGPLGTNVDELGGQYAPHQDTSAYPEGSLYDRCKGNSTASSSRCSIETPPTLFPRILLSSPPSADCYKKTPQWSTFHNNNEAELELRKMEDWLTVDDEVDHIPSTPPSLLTSSDDNMSANKFIIWFLIS